MLEKYDCAAIRHYENAGLLRDNGCLDNAGHLIGFAAECAIKHSVLTFDSGMQSLHGHLPELITIALKHMSGRGSSSKTLLLDMQRQGVFGGWDVRRRYYESGTTLTTELDEWFRAANRLIGCAGIRARK